MSRLRRGAAAAAAAQHPARQRASKSSSNWNHASTTKMSEAAAGVEHDISLLRAGIERLGKPDANGNLAVTFGELFKDETLEQQLESLVGSLKAAKKRKMLDFPGQMLLQGAHDHVVITYTPAAAQ